MRHERRAQHHARNAGLQRLRKLTRALAVTATALAAIFAGIAAASNSGRKHPRVPRPITPRRRTTPELAPKRIPPPPSLPPIQSGEGTEGQAVPAPPPPPPPSQQPAPAPQQPVAPPPAPPVAVSGGS